MAAAELVEYVAKSLVDDPDAVKVEVVRDQGGTVIELHVADDDMGKVIGRNGSVAKALRTLLKVTAARDGEPVSLEILYDTADDEVPDDRVTGERLVVALVRGVHGLNGAVRVEILTDHPEDRYAPGTVLHREGSDEPLTVAWSSPVGRRAGLARCASTRSPRARRPTSLRARTSSGSPVPRPSWVAASTSGTRSSGRPCAASTAPSSGPCATSTEPVAPRSSSSMADRTASSTCRPSGRSSGSSPRGAARSSSTPRRST